MGHTTVSTANFTNALTNFLSALEFVTGLSGHDHALMSNEFLPLVAASPRLPKLLHGVRASYASMRLLGGYSTPSSLYRQKSLATSRRVTTIT